MNVIILSGFLGAGKTSLLLQLAAHIAGGQDRAATQDRTATGSENGWDDTGSTIDATSDGKTRVAILENEIGKVSVDGATLRSQGIEVRELFSGCVCCTLTGELASSIMEIEQKLQPHWLIIEATGLAFPDKTAEIVRDYAENLESLKIVVLIDAEHFLVLDSIVPLISGQPKFADLLLLNKVDLVDEQIQQETIDRLREINTDAPLFEIVATESLPDELLQEVLG
jgi:G3E family GTPase